MDEDQNRFQLACGLGPYIQVETILALGRAQLLSKGSDNGRGLRRQTGEIRDASDIGRTIPIVRRSDEHFVLLWNTHGLYEWSVIA
jgi:hypothetical protein